MKTFLLILVLIFNQGCMGGMIAGTILSFGHEIMQDQRIKELEQQQSDIYLEKEMPTLIEDKK